MGSLKAVALQWCCGVDILVQALNRPNLICPPNIQPPNQLCSVNIRTSPSSVIIASSPLLLGPRICHAHCGIHNIVKMCQTSFCYRLRLESGPSTLWGCFEHIVWLTFRTNWAVSVTGYNNKNMMLSHVHVRSLGWLPMCTRCKKALRTEAPHGVLSRHWGKVLPYARDLRDIWCMWDRFTAIINPKIHHKPYPVPFTVTPPPQIC